MPATAIHNAVPRLPVSPLDPPRIARFDVMITMDDWSVIRNKKSDYDLFICNISLEKRAGSSHLGNRPRWSEGWGPLHGRSCTRWRAWLSCLSWL